MNVVFTSVDCARPDAFEADSFEPFMARGTYFDTCIAQAPFTSPSHLSMLTGLYPFNHGVRWLIDYETESTTLPQQLSEAGFNTAAFVGGYPLPTGNLDVHFDTFEQHTTLKDEMEGRQEFGPANVLVNRAINWLSENDGDDNFVFLHCFDLHFTLRSEFGKREPPDFDDDNVYQNVEQYIGRQRGRYYDEAAFVGRQLRLLDSLVDVDFWVITADHGTKMPGEHGYPWVYNYKGERVGSQFRAVELYDNLIRVPLLLVGEPFDSKRIHQQVRSVDIVPTLLDALDVMGRSTDFDGHSLNTGKFPDRAYSETYHGQLTRANRLTYQMNEQYDFGWSDIDSLVCLRSNKWKLICTANGDFEPIELYRIDQDPAESQNCIETHEDVVSKYFSELTSMVGEDEQRYVSADRVSDETRDHLEDLGYL